MSKSSTALSIPSTGMKVARGNGNIHLAFFSKHQNDAAVLPMTIIIINSYDESLVVKYLQQVFRLECHAAPATYYWTIACMPTFLMLAYVRVRISIKVAEDTLVVTLTSMSDAHRISQLYNVKSKNWNWKSEKTQRVQTSSRNYTTWFSQCDFPFTIIQPCNTGIEQTVLREQWPFHNNNRKSQCNSGRGLVARMLYILLLEKNTKQ